MGSPRRGGMMGRVPMSAGLLSQVAADRSMRGASTQGMKKGGSVSASKRADGCATKGKTKGRMV
jgi:phage tail tube protein FII